MACHKQLDDGFEVDLGIAPMLSISSTHLVSIRCGALDVGALA